MSHRQYRCRGSTSASDEHRRDDGTTRAALAQHPSGGSTCVGSMCVVVPMSRCDRRPQTAVCPCIGRMAVACDVRSTPIVQKGQTAAAVSFVGCLHLPLVDLLGVRGGLRCVARCWWIRPGRGWVKSPEDRATNRGLEKAHPATGGAGWRRRGRSAAHKMASTSSNNSTTSWSRRTRSRSDMSLPTGMAATLVCVITTPRLVPVADQALMAACPLVRPISILRGLARSATGMRNRSTPSW